jgi:hypothetical protein
MSSSVTDTLGVVVLDDMSGLASDGTCRGGNFLDRNFHVLHLVVEVHMAVLLEVRLCVNFSDECASWASRLKTSLLHIVGPEVTGLGGRYIILSI